MMEILIPVLLVVAGLCVCRYLDYRVEDILRTC